MPEPKVIVNDIKEVIINGNPVGSVSDVYENYRKVDGIRGAVDKALIKWRDDFVKMTIDARAALEEQHIKDKLDLVNKHDEERLHMIAEHEKAINQKDKEIEDLNGLIDALGGTELARKLKREKRRQIAEGIRAAVAEELARLDAEEEQG